LAELTHTIDALKQENTLLKNEIGFLQESIEALEGHGIDIDPTC
jgi:hypothetical protein